MSKDYQPKSTREYVSHNLWMQAIYMIRDYDRLIAERDAIIDEVPLISNGKSVGKIGDPTGSKAARIENVSHKIHAIEKALRCIPSEYRDGVINNIKYRTAYPDYANVRTWSRYKAKFISDVVKNMHWI